MEPRDQLQAAIGTVICAVCAVGARLDLPPRHRAEATLAFTHVAVVDVSAGAVRRDQTVIVTGRRIVSVGPASTTRVPSDARVVDAATRYLVPGLWDMHAHLAMTGRKSLGVFLANGVTGVRDMGGGYVTVRGWRDSVDAGTMAGPRLRVAGPIIEGARWRESVIDLLRGEGRAAEASSIAERIGVATPEDASRAVDSIATLGADFVKVRTGPNAATYFAILRSARAHGLRVVGHASTHVPLASASDSGMASFEHGFFGVIDGRGGMELDSVPPAARRTLFRRFVQNKSAVTPTLIAGRGYRLTPDSVVLAILADTLGRIEPRRRYASPELVAQWRGQIALKKYEGTLDWAANHRSRIRDLREMDTAGVPILVGTDSGVPLVFPGFSLHDELELLVREGRLTPAEALRAATMAPATFFGATDSLGTIAPGKFADLVLLRANPLDDIRNTTKIHAVVANGRVFLRPALDSLLATARH